MPRLGATQAYGCPGWMPIPARMSSTSLPGAACRRNAGSAVSATRSSGVPRSRVTYRQDCDSRRVSTAHLRAVADQAAASDVPVNGPTEWASIATGTSCCCAAPGAARYLVLTP